MIRIWFRLLVRDLYSLEFPIFGMVLQKMPLSAGRVYLGHAVWSSSLVQLVTSVVIAFSQTQCVSADAVEKL